MILAMPELSIRQNVCLRQDIQEHPVTFRESTVHILNSSHNALQTNMNVFSDFTHENEFIVN